MPLPEDQLRRLRVLPEEAASWGEYRRLILSELERIGRDIETINKKLDGLRQDDLAQVRVDIAMLQVKSGVWGALSGLVVALGAALLGMIK